MLSIHTSGTSLCDGLTRREWLRVGGLGLAGLSLPALSQARIQAAARGATGGKAKSCIVLFFLGGPAQHETWDPKPDAPAEVRGDLKPIASALPGLMVGELMPRVAKLTRDICVLRGVCTNDGAHTTSGYYMTTGYPHQPPTVESVKPGPPNTWPCLGSLVRSFRQVGGSLPAAVTLPEQLFNDNTPHPWPGQDAGFLGRSADPLLYHCDPVQNTHAEGFALHRDVPPLRFDQRRSLLTQVSQHMDATLRSAAAAQHDAIRQQALDVMTSAPSLRAFDLDREPAKVRDRYGRHAFGQSVLLARRLAEAGVSLIRVNWPRVKGALNAGHWDTHSKNTEGLKQLMPIMDETYSALLEDLSQRGMLDETLVVWMAEFGRTPRINGNAGRDHWGRVFSVALAGGGVRGGMIHGASDNIAGSPTDGRVMPQDLLATILHCLGAESDAEIRDPLGRPIPLMRGDVIRQII